VMRDIEADDAFVPVLLVMMTGADNDEMAAEEVEDTAIVDVMMAGDIAEVAAGEYERNATALRLEAAEGPSFFLVHREN